MTVAEAMERIDSREFAQWMAFFELDPWGESRTEMAIAKGNFAKHPGSKFETWIYQPPVENPKQHLVHKIKAVFGTAFALQGNKK